MNIVGFSGIHNGDYYRKQFGLRFVGHDAAVALIRDGEILFAAEEERFSRVPPDESESFTSDSAGVRFPISSCGYSRRARLDVAGPDRSAVRK
jgi:hypothetical protein